MQKVGGILETDNLTLYKFSDLKDQPGSAAEVLNFFGAKNLNLEYITETSASNDIAAMTVCVKKAISKKMDSFLKDYPKLKKSLKVEKKEEVSMLGIYGPHFREKPAIAAKFCSLIGKAGVNMLSLSCSISSVCCVIKSKHLSRAKSSLLEYFKLP